MLTHLKLYFHVFKYRPRLTVSIIIGALSSYLLFNFSALHASTIFLLSWNFFVFSYLLLASQIVIYANPQKIRRRARFQSESSVIMMIFVVIATLASLAAIVLELSILKDLSTQVKIQHLVLAGLTIASSWIFTHLMFGIHYAHKYYEALNQHQNPGIIFPEGEQSPDYWDFIYTAFIIGTSAQTADVSFSSKSMRRSALVHSIAAFFFNTTILALTINIAASLIS